MLQFQFQQFSQVYCFLTPESRVPFPKDLAVGTDHIDAGPALNAIVFVIAVVLIPQHGVLDIPLIETPFRFCKRGQSAAGNLHND